MGKKKPTFNTAMAKIEKKQNSQQDYTTEFAKETTFDQVNLLQSESSKNKQFKPKHDVEFGLDAAVKTNNKQSVSRNKKNNRHGNRNRQNNN